MIRIRRKLMSWIVMAGLCCNCMAMADVARDTRIWNFAVRLDEDLVGSHQFALTDKAGVRLLESKAQFDVRVLMIKAYSYFHEARETWKDDCLESITARTDDNGKKSSLSGQLKPDYFDLGSNTEQIRLPTCVMTFAYWNPLMLKQSRLLNPQTGEYTEVSIQAKGRDSIPVRGRPVAANRYHLDAGKFQIELWYADNGDWLALDSRLDNGHTLQYRLP